MDFKIEPIKNIRQKESYIMKTFSSNLEVCGRECKIMVNVCGHELPVLIDSGATDCLAGPKLLEYIPEAKEHLKRLTQPTMGTVANGKQFKCEQSISFNFKIDGDVVPITAFYSDTINFPLIIGYNILASNRLIVDFETLEITRKTDTSVKLSDKITLKPNSETIVYGYLAVPLKRDTGIVTSSLPVQQIGLLAANGIVNLGKAIIPVKLLNLSKQATEVPAHFPIATCRELENDERICDRNQPPSLSVNSTTNDMPTVTRPGEQNNQANFMKQFDLQETSLTAEQVKELSKLLWEYNDIFAQPGQKLGCTDLVEFNIRLRPDAKPIRARPYRSNPKIRKEIRKQVEKMLKDKIIRPSTSNYVSPVLLVAKADSSYRFCTDYRSMNSKNIVPESATLPRIDDSLESIGSARAKIFTTLDLEKGYWQIPVSEESKQYTAFCTHDGVFEYERMPFGLANSPACFMRLMSRVLQGLTWETCLVYLDDIIIFSQDFEEHLTRVRAVFDRLRNAHLTLKPSKCSFGRRQIRFLGHVISKDGILPLPDKIALIENYKQPETKTEVRAFLGLAGYYRKFIKGYAKIAVPLNELTKDDVPFVWCEKCDEAFITLRKALISPPILAYPDYDKPYILETDASQSAAGYILSQVQEGQTRVIAYSGQKLNDAQRNYNTTEKEALAVVLGFQHYDSFLRGNKVHVVTDHIALKWLLTNKTPKGRLARWIAYLQQFDFEVEHKAGKLHANADTMSRIMYAACGGDVEDKIDEEIFMLESNAIELGETATPTPNPTPNYLYPTHIWTTAQVREQQLHDDKIGDIIAFIEHGKLPEDDVRARRILLSADMFHLSAGVLYKVNTKPHTRVRQIDDMRVCLVVPKALRHDILASHHGDDCAGHYGYRRTYETLQLKYYWEGMLVDTKNWVFSCKKCNTKKSPVRPVRAPLNPLPPTYIGERWAMDLITMPRSHRGNKVILTFTEYLSRYVEAFPLPNGQAPTIARVLVDEICFRYGAPMCLLSDLGQNLVSKVVAETCKLFKIERVHTSPYHPQCNGLLEKFNATLCQNLGMYVNSQHTDWDVYVRAICYSYNQSICTESSRFSPFYILYGRVPLHPIDTVILPENYSQNDSIKESIVKLQEAREIARQNIICAQERMKQRYDVNAQDPQFEPGDLVWIYIPQILVGGSRKFFHNYSGPYILLNKTSPVDFEVAHAHNNKKLRNKVHVNRLKRFHHRSIVPTPDDQQRAVTNVTHDVEDIHPLDAERVSNYADQAQHQALPLAPQPRLEQDFLAPLPLQIPAAPEMPPTLPEETEQQCDAAEDTEIGEQTYEINEVIQGKYNKKGGKEYLIDWKGYTEADRTWEPYRNLNESARNYVDTTDVEFINANPKNKK